MKRFLFFMVSLLTMCPLVAQKKDFTYKFYGFVRGDIFYNTRANVAAVDGLFYLYPQDKVYDVNGRDLNATPNGSFYTFTTRLGLDLTGPALGKARTSAKIETDFGGFSSSSTMLRIRQAYVALDWEKTQLLIGQTWHPLSGIMPDVLNLSTGAPMNAFNRSPMFRLRQRLDNMQLTTAAVWQLQYMSTGPVGASQDYIKNSGIPELFLGIDYISNGWQIGTSANFLSIRPRTVSEMSTGKYKVHERVSGLTYGAHLKYAGRKFVIAAKSKIASMVDNSALLGGYGVKSFDPVSGKQEYTPFRHSTSWINITYGNTWRAGIFAGYTKTLGTSDALYSKEEFKMTTYGKGLNIDQLLLVNPSISYNLLHWKIGMEYCIGTAWYGDIRLNGKVENPHSVTNHRILGLIVYHF